MMDITAVIDGDIAYASDTPAHVSVQPGGAASNIAAWMALDGQSVTIVGCVGDDDFGRSIRGQLEDLGVEVRLQQASVSTGTCIVLVDSAHERTMFPDAGANAHLAPEPLAGLVTPGSHLHLSGYTLLNPATRPAGLSLLEESLDVGATCSLDPASAAPLRAQVALIRDLLPRFDLVLANELEASVLTGLDDPERSLSALAELVGCAVVKVGARGVLARDASGTVVAPAPTCEVVDTTGAGDAFTSAFLPAWLAHRPLAEAVAEGQRLASVAISRVGAGPLVR